MKRVEYAMCGLACGVLMMGGAWGANDGDVEIGATVAVVGVIAYAVLTVVALLKDGS